MESVDVLVVGAGPTGLMLAAELFRRGVSCRVIDEHRAPLAWDRATVVHPRTLEIFDALGIVEPLLAAGVKQRRAVIHSAGRGLGEIDLASCGSRYGFNVGVSEEVTERLLTERLSECGGAVVRGARLVDIEPLADGAVATVEENGAAGHTLARWIVACDGSHSVARAIAGVDLEGRDIERPWAVFDAAISAWPDSHEANYAYLDDVPLILTALPEGRWRAYVRPVSPDSDLVADATSTLRRYAKTSAFVDVANPARFHCCSKVAARYRAGRILLAGDAAHLCSPAQGHGMNSGVQDAFNLAWKLALVCQGRASPALLDSYEAERRPVAQAIVKSGDDVERAQTLTDPAERDARDAAIRARLTDAKERHGEAVAEAELDIDYAASPIVLGRSRPAPAPAPGQRLPDGIVVRRASGETCALHELAHRPGHTALLIAGPSSRQGEIVPLEAGLRAAARPGVVDAVVVVSAGAGALGSGVRRPGAPDALPKGAPARDGRDGVSPSGSAAARLDSDAAARLGVDAMTLLVIRPDGHVGLRADARHAEALSAYLANLCDAPAAG